MKVLFISPYFYPHIGGVEKHSFEVAKKMIGSGIEVSVITQKSFSKEQDEVVVKGIKIHRFWAGRKAFFKKFRIWGEIWKRRKLIAKADIIHCHDVFFWYLPFKFLFPLKKVYITFHGFEGKFPPSKKAIMIRKISEELSLGNIIVGDYIRKWYGTNPDFVTYGGVEESKIPKSKLSKKLKILFIGRLDEDTGVRNYLTALDILKQSGVEFEFEACGDGQLASLVKKIGRVNGFVKDLKPHIDKADLILSSSYLSILEALVGKKAVVATYDNSLKEDYLKMSPFSKFIIIENNPFRLALKIQNFSKLVDKNKGYAWAKNQNWDKVTNIYFKLWRK